MRSSINRSKKYKAKTDGKVVGIFMSNYGKTQKSQFRQASGRQVKIEHKVKSILEDQGVMPALNHFYMNFGKKLDRIKATYHGGAMWDEACIEYGKWELRGLDKDILDQITCLIMVSPCNPCPECPPGYGLPWTGQTVVYYAGDDGTYQKGLTLDRPIVKGAGSPRFTDNGDGTVTDNATGLMWVKDHNALGSPFNGTVIWTDAIDACEALSFAGHDDWRLPNVKELGSIFDYSLGTPWTDPAFFTLFSNGSYWTSTTQSTSPTYAYWWSLLYCTISRSAKLTKFCYVLPVRAGQP